MVEYQYGPDGLRRGKKVDGRNRYHVWDGANMVLEIGVNGVTAARYLRGLELIAREQDGKREYYHQNGHGDIILRTDAWGNALKAYAYDAFGVEQEREKLDTNPFRYCGEYWDEETETIYLRARNYRPAVGSFWSEDPARDGLHWYAYCAGNPVSFVDPSGCSGILLAILAAMGLVAGLTGCTSIERADGSVENEPVNIPTRAVLRPASIPTRAVLRPVSIPTRAVVPQPVEEIDYSRYGQRVEVDNFSALDDTSLIARMIFHEDSISGQAAIAWTIHNRLVDPGYGEADTLRGIIMQDHVPYMVKPSEPDDDDKKYIPHKFWDPYGYIAYVKDTQYWGVDAGKTVSESWENAVRLAIALVSSGKDTNAFIKAAGPSPFPDSSYRYYVDDSVSHDPNQMQIGNNWFSNDFH